MQEKQIVNDVLSMVKSSLTDYTRGNQRVLKSAASTKTTTNPQC